MPYAFVSHASKDKRTRVRPLVEALALLGIELWVDRCGHGDDGMGLDDDFIVHHGIRSLRYGGRWGDEIRAAIAKAGAVLACVSRSLCEDRVVLQQEVLLGLQFGKLVACVVDGMPLGELPHEVGLIDFLRIQVGSIDTEALHEALQHLKGCAMRPSTVAHDPLPRLPEDVELQLSAPQSQAWQVVRKLARDIHAIFGTRLITPDWSRQHLFARFIEERRQGFTGRRWLYDAILAWPAERPRERMVLLTGAPGTGKSAALAHFLAEEQRDGLIAYHCFRHDDSRTLGIDAFARNIAFMLKERLPEYCRLLAAPAPQGAFLDLEHASEEGADLFFRHAIADVLGQLARPAEFGSRPAWIVIDGLDEVAGGEGQINQARLIELFDYGLQRLPPWIRVLASSRGGEVVEQLCRLDHGGYALVRQVSLDDCRSEDGMCESDATYRAYVEMRLDGGPTMSEQTKLLLLDRAERNFLYLKLVLDRFNAGQYNADDITRLPPSLQRIYAHDFHRLYGGPGGGGSFRGVTQPLLETLAVARNPLSAQTLGAITGLDLIDVKRELHRLASLLAVEDDRYVLFHKSFNDWLVEGDGGMKYGFSAREGHRRIANYCWQVFQRHRHKVGASIASLAHERGWVYTVRHGIDHMLSADRIGWAIALVHFLLANWNDEEDAKPPLEDIAPDHFKRVVLRAFRVPEAGSRRSTQDVDAQSLAELLTDFYQIEPLKAPLEFLFTEHPDKWTIFQDRFLAAENYVVRYAMSEVLAQHCRMPGTPVDLDCVHRYVAEGDINQRELGAYTLRHLYSWSPRLIRVEHLELMGDSETYPARSALGDLLLNLTFQRCLDVDQVKSRRFWEPIWDHNRIDVWDIGAARCFLAGNPLPNDASMGVRAAYAQLEQIEAIRKELQNEPQIKRRATVVQVLDRFYQLGSQLKLICDAEQELMGCPLMTAVIRLLFSHPLWDVAETAASVLTSRVERDRSSQNVVLELLQSPYWRIRFGAIETAFQLAAIDRMTLFGEAVKRLYEDENSRVRALCAENLISHILERPAALQARYLEEFSAPIRRWLNDDDCWVLEHVFRLLRKLSNPERFFEIGMPALFEGLPPEGWHDLSRETFLHHIERNKRRKLDSRPR